MQDSSNNFSTTLSLGINRILSYGHFCFRADSFNNSSPHTSTRTRVRSWKALTSQRYFSNVPFLISHISLALIFIYCRYKFILAKCTKALIPYCTESNIVSLFNNFTEKCFKQKSLIIFIFYYVSSYCKKGYLQEK